MQLLLAAGAHRRNFAEAFGACTSGTPSSASSWRNADDKVGLGDMGGKRGLVELALLRKRHQLASVEGSRLTDSRQILAPTPTRIAARASQAITNR